MVRPVQGSPPVRVPNGVHRDRLSLILAVLSKHSAVKPFQMNVHTNVVGGMMMREPSTDLAVALAIAASYFSATVPPQMAVIGELGLGGELRCAAAVQRPSGAVTHCARVPYKLLATSCHLDDHRLS